MLLSTDADKRGRSISLVTLARVASLRCLLSFLSIIAVTLGSRAKEVRSKLHTFWFYSRTAEAGSKTSVETLIVGLHGYGNNAYDGKGTTKAIKPVDLAFGPSFFSSDSAHHLFKGF